MKPRRDITLGEMQDECKRFTDGLCGGKSCAYQDLCNQIVKSGCTPHAWDLTDPPRFNEAQMALLKAFFDIGGVIVRANSISTTNYIVENLNGTSIGAIFERIGFKLEQGETLDLAELLGKESNEK